MNDEDEKREKLEDLMEARNKSSDEKPTLISDIKSIVIQRRVDQIWEDMKAAERMEPRKVSAGSEKKAQNNQGKRERKARQVYFDLVYCNL